MADVTAEAQAPQHLSFTVAGTDYGLPILKVREILQHEEPTRVPGAPASIRGVLNVRGAVVPVVDLAVKFGRPETVATKRTCVLVVETLAGADRLTLGLVADAVNEVLDLPMSAVEPPPVFGAGVRVDYLTGVGKVGKGFVLLLGLERCCPRPRRASRSSSRRERGTPRRRRSPRAPDREFATHLSQAATPVAVAVDGLTSYRGNREL